MSKFADNDWIDFDNQSDWIKFLIEKEHLYPKGVYKKGEKIPADVSVIVKDDDPKWSEFYETKNAVGFFVVVTRSVEGNPQIVVETINSMKALKRDIKRIKTLQKFSNLTINN